MGSTTNAIFSGSSRCANDFQQVITRAVSLASLPMQEIQNEVGNLQSRWSELTTLSTKFSALNTSLQSLNNALGLGSYISKLSDSDVASVSLSGSPYTGTYSIEVVDTG